jgi:hypothetical protein
VRCNFFVIYFVVLMRVRARKAHGFVRKSARRFISVGAAVAAGRSFIHQGSKTAKAVGGKAKSIVRNSKVQNRQMQPGTL